ncbi:quinone-dependent dihydroorotate dehydrogenase [Erythrobacter litoralis]|uniref:quinone-dependent dihydroorotate dehydrogenase n=1 Tax=Erythrobacter litoralis TaxID=39960 RepID=UPI002435532D|nr:quinone-dependent dihydroorotate dehydrogenase [Erythrobacter litoralis]MDG6079455.1 quinone-dependent dihydroorotate dehydrogenase [Erythrobacter litoralis]
MLFRLARPALFALDPERAHRMTIAGLKRLPVGKAPRTRDGLGVGVAGLHFPNPLGLAAGFDKDAEVPDAMLRFGFGHVEVGSITPRPQVGNPKPRLFRLADDHSVINRMGFNNGGARAAVERLTLRKNQAGIVGVNIGANKDSDDRVADYVAMARIVAPLADYIAVNISSPNTPGLRALQDANLLADLLDAVLEARGADGPPVFLKVAPDLQMSDIDAIAQIAAEKRLGALIVSNTTIERPALRSRNAREVGGLSGAGLKPLALQRLRDFRKATDGTIPLVGVGGIANGEDAWERIRAGASLVQLYSAMVYGGPGLPSRILEGLERLMRRDGFSTIADAVGSE